MPTGPRDTRPSSCHERERREARDRPAPASGLGLPVDGRWYDLVMDLPPGARIGPYEVLARLGAGGMGEVYRARDTRLHREVAIKRLAPDLAGASEARARLLREARLLASLSHPNIAAAYGFEESGGADFLVMELVAGENLADRIARAPLAWRDALDVALQIAAALGAAHERGLVHRDLKPGNVIVDSNGRVKLLDFGIARSLAGPAGGAGAQDVTATAMTAAGALLGTPAYMSPEQLRGAEVDERADIWAFGCVLFEMLAGASPFGGATAADTIARALASEPDWSRLPHEVPDRFRSALRSCLAKDPSHRVSRIADVVAVLSAARTPTTWPAEQVRPAPQRLVQVTFEEGVQQYPAWSPDGAELVYSGPAGPVRHLYRRTPGAPEPIPLTTGLYDDILPSWSPDGAVYFVRAREPGRQLEPADVFGQHQEGDVWAVDVATGRERRVVESAFNPVAAPDGGRLAVDASWAGPRRIWIIDRDGGDPVQVSSDPSSGVAHVRPRWFPDGRRLVFQTLERTQFQLGVVDLATRRVRALAVGGYQNYQPAVSRRGDAIFFASQRTGGLNLWMLPIDGEGEPAAAPVQITHGAGQDVEPAPAPDGRRVAFTILRQNASLFRLPVDPRTGRPSGAPEKLVESSREDSRGAWSPAGSRVAFNSDRGGAMNLWIREADGRLVQVTRGAGGDFQPNWAPDESRLVFFSSRSGHPGVWSVNLTDGALTSLSPTARGERRGIEINPIFSPGGDRIAFQSDADGRLEVWVMDADGAHPRQLTRVGITGHFMRWTDDGLSIVFRSAGAPARTLRAAADGGTPAPLPEIAGGAHMSFSPDRRRIMDVVGHKTLWVSPLDGGRPEPVFEFDDPAVRIDYPSWSPDGRWVLFDRFRPQGGDIWIAEEE